MRTHFGGGGLMKLRISRGSSKLVFLGHFEDGGAILVVFLALWRNLGLVKGEGAHHHSVLREALSQFAGAATRTNTWEYHKIWEFRMFG